MDKPLTQLNKFFELATDRKLSGSDQLMYLHIFNKFNQAHWTETLRIKDAELAELDCGAAKVDEFAFIFAVGRFTRFPAPVPSRFFLLH